MVYVILNFSYFFSYFNSKYEKIDMLDTNNKYKI